MASSSEYMDDDEARAAAMMEDQDCQDEVGTSPSAAAAQSPQQQQANSPPPFEWSAFLDASGRTYYYNASTEESSWEPPEEGFNPLEEELAQANEGNVDDSHIETPTIEFEDPAANMENEQQQDEILEQESADKHDAGEHPIPSTPENFAGEGTTVGESNATAAEEGHPVAEHTGDGASADWVAYQDDEGREYFYNAVTGETQWERPESGVVVAPVEEAIAPEEESSTMESTDTDTDKQTIEPTAAATEEEEPVETEAMKGEEKEEEPEEVIDPVQKALENAERALKEPDAIMEPGCLDNVSDLVNGLGGSVGGQKAMQMLVSGYSGQTAVCGLFALWLADLKADGVASSTNLITSKSSSSVNVTSSVSAQRDPFVAAADATRAAAENVVHKIAMERFTKTGGDNILNLSKAEAAFLEEMIDSDEWRRLLIDLSATHKDSALLMYCLQSISKKGHHREIARRINQSDYFSVFNGMLASELSVIGKIAVSGMPGSSGIDAVVGMKGLIDDLRRTCTSTSYTYLYAIQVLHELVARAKEKKFPEGPRAAGIRRAIQKWDKLREELEDTMVHPPESATSESPLQRKRRLDVALTITELHQRRRQRLMYIDDTSNGVITSNNRQHRKALSHEDTVNAAIDSAVLNLIKKHSLGIQIDEQLADQLLRSINGKRERVGGLLLEHPSSVTALLVSLFQPGPSRMRSIQTRGKCARLVGLAVLAAEEAALNSVVDQKTSPGTELQLNLDEDKLTKCLLKGSMVCEQLENMVSFTVTEEVEEEELEKILKEASSSSSTSIGRQLSSLAIRCPPVAQGILLWATALSSGSEFVASASYPTLSPSILALGRIISIHHPFTRPSVLNLVVIFLKHSSRDLSYQKTTALKEQGLRMLLWLATKGQAIAVFDTVADRLQNGGSMEIDAALLRYFFCGVVEIFGPPFSLPFIQSMGKVMLIPRCVDALRSPYFDLDNKKGLVGIVQNFHETAFSKSRQHAPKASYEDRAIVDSLVSIYGNP